MKETSGLKEEDFEHFLKSRPDGRGEVAKSTIQNESFFDPKLDMNPKHQPELSHRQLETPSKKRKVCKSYQDFGKYLL